MSQAPIKQLRAAGMCRLDTFVEECNAALFQKGQGGASIKRAIADARDGDFSAFEYEMGTYLAWLDSVERLHDILSSVYMQTVVRIPMFAQTGAVNPSHRLFTITSVGFGPHPDVRPKYSNDALKLPNLPLLATDERTKYPEVLMHTQTELMEMAAPLIAGQVTFTCYDVENLPGDFMMYRTSSGKYKNARSGGIQWQDKAYIDPFRPVALRGAPHLGKDASLRKMQWAADRACDAFLMLSELYDYGTADYTRSEEDAFILTWLYYTTRVRQICAKRLTWMTHALDQGLLLKRKVEESAEDFVRLTDNILYYYGTSPIKTIPVHRVDLPRFHEVAKLHKVYATTIKPSFNVMRFGQVKPIEDKRLRLAAKEDREQWERYYRTNHNLNFTSAVQLSKEAHIERVARMAATLKHDLGYKRYKAHNGRIRVRTELDKAMEE